MEFSFAPVVHTSFIWWFEAIPTSRLLKDGREVRRWRHWCFKPWMTLTMICSHWQSVPSIELLIWACLVFIPRRVATGHRNFTQFSTHLRIPWSGKHLHSSSPTGPYWRLELVGGDIILDLWTERHYRGPLRLGKVKQTTAKQVILQKEMLVAISKDAQAVPSTPKVL